MPDHTHKRDLDGKQKLESIKQKLWAALVHIPTTLGRMVYLTSLRDEGTGRYWDSGLAGGCNEDEADLLLCEIHEEVFATWLSFSLKDQREELEQYLESLKQQGSGEFASWLTQVPYLKLIPTSAGAAERELYRSDLEIVLELLEDDLMQS